jgi:D-alanyl-D-alanine carboxypeptidase/D-alanyl-D-alanine-endopeptidase (penicillin-binding protein 4)
MRFRAPLLISLLIGVSSLSPISAHAVDPRAVTSAFSQLTSIPELAEPSVIVLDEVTGDVIYESNSQSPRKPASVIKLISAASAYTYLNPADSFTTSLYVGVDGKSLLLEGSLDPWISYDHKVAVKMGRTSLQRIEFNALKKLEELQGSTIYYSNLWAGDINHFKSFLRDHKSKVKLERVSRATGEALKGDLVLTSTSPTLETILDWTLTWSDNLLAERIARLASVAAGNSLDDEGVAQTFANLLADMGINTSKLIVKDASGLSKSNRVTAVQIAQLLMVMYHNPKFAPLIKGLPVGGQSGTLRERFIETAPDAVGLVRAKTGTLNGTTNLAGYVESGDHEYIFVIIADRHHKSYTVTKKVRATVDRILGKIAAPLEPVLISESPFGESVTATR